MPLAEALYEERSFIAMASKVVVVADQADQVLDAAQEIFERYEAVCSRFLDSSELNRYCASEVTDSFDPLLVAVLRDAYLAYQDTAGVFDPRVRRTLEALGYDVTFSRVSGNGRVPQSRGLGPWQDPVGDEVLGILNPSPESLDLGGIAKGHALRALRRAVRRGGATGLCSAGGDVVVFSGEQPWSIGVEDPLGVNELIAVLSVQTGAVMTSSTRVRTWTAGDDVVHHLIDPKTMQPGSSPLTSVTVINDDPVLAEVWSKTLFLAKGAHVEVAKSRGLAALFVDSQGAVTWSEEAAPFVSWVRA